MADASRPGRSALPYGTADWHELATTEDYLAVHDGHASKFAPGERFAYCNAGYVVLAVGR